MISSLLRRACRPAFARLVSVALLLPALCAAAETVSVTATRTPMRVSDLVAEVTVLDRTAIERAQGRTLVELLASQSGLQFSSNGGLGKVSSLFIRGLEARHTLLLVDGVRVSSVTLGTPSLDNLPLETIERIEIVRGPMSGLYGSGAMGGVIQIFTRRGTQGLTANAMLSAGSTRRGETAAGAAFGNGTVDAAVQAQHVEMQGRSASNPRVPFGSYNADRDGFRQNAGSVRLGWQPWAEGRVELLHLHSNGLTALDDGPGASARAGLANRLTSLSARGAVLPGWTSRLSVSESLDAYETLASASAFTSLGVITSRQKQWSWENGIATPVGTALVLAERQEETVGRPGQPFSLSDRRIDALALGLNGSGGGHHWQGSLRRDRNSQFGGATTGALGWGYAVTPAWRLGASYGQSFVAPSFNQLYFPSFGNALLQPETGKHAEVNLRWTLGEHRVSMAYFEHRYRSFISSGPQPVNLPLARIDGLTLSYEGRWRELDLTASLDHTDPRNATAGNANFDRLLPRRARDIARLAADWTQGAWAFGATAAGFSHRYDDAANTVRLGGYGTLDLRVAYALSGAASLALKLNNLADKPYETALGYNQPGREAFVTLRTTWR